MQKLITIVIPSFNEEANISVLVDLLCSIRVPDCKFEIIFVDDGSTDRTLNIIKDYSSRYEEVKYLSFSRNFGHQIALKAGIDYAKGDCVISMDADMQHPPEMIPDLIQKWKQGFDIVYTKRQDDKRLPFFKRISSMFFYWLMRFLSDFDMESGTADFRLLDRKVVDVLAGLQEQFIYFRGMIPWVGFKQACIEYLPKQRHAGVSKYSFKKMLLLATNGITSFSIRPLHLATLLGMFMSGLTFLYGFYSLCVHLFTDQTISGWTSVIVSILFVGGIQLIILGIIGEYIGKIFMESKRRPLYIVKEKNE